MTTATRTAYVLPRIPGTPIYATRLTEGLVQGELPRAQAAGVDPGSRRPFAVGVFRVPVSHSIPDGVGYAIQTPARTGCVHTGDFKLDHTRPTGVGPTSGPGRDGGAASGLLLSDSTRAEREGYALSEATVGESLHRLVGEARGRVIVATFAGDIGRVQQVIDAAWAHGRVTPEHGAEHCMAWTHAHLVDENQNGTLVRKDQLQRLPRRSWW